VARLVAQVGELFTAGVPGAFNRVNGIEGLVGGGVVTHVVEDEEFGFRAKECGVADAGGLEVCLGLFGDVARVAAVTFLGDRIKDVADQGKGRNGDEGVYLGSGGVGDDDHVGSVDRLPATDGRTVKAEAFLEYVLAEFADRCGKMLPDSNKIHEFEINHQCAVFLGKFYYLFRGHEKISFRVLMKYLISTHLPPYCSSL
jgi:hypothetical protein